MTDNSEWIDEQKGEMVFTAREFVDELMRIDVGLYEQVLDAISDHHNPSIQHNDDDLAYFAWDSTDDGRMIMYIQETEDGE